LGERRLKVVKGRRWIVLKVKNVIPLSSSSEMISLLFFIFFVFVFVFVFVLASSFWVVFVWGIADDRGCCGLGTSYDIR
jgi:hypothetical protein